MRLLCGLTSGAGSPESIRREIELPGYVTVSYASGGSSVVPRPQQLVRNGRAKCQLSANAFGTDKSENLLRRVRLFVIVGRGAVSGKSNRPIPAFSRSVDIHVPLVRQLSGVFPVGCR